MYSLADMYWKPIIATFQGDNRKHTKLIQTGSIYSQNLQSKRKDRT